MIWRNVWCARLRPADIDGGTPAQYRRAQKFDARRPGTYGEGMGGEALVCLLPEDDGRWFLALACRAPQGGCHHDPKPFDDEKGEHREEE